MRFDREFEEKREEPGAPVDRAEDAELEQALGNFRLSVKAWSEAEMNRPRTVTRAARYLSWRLAAGWALGLVLVTGGASGAIYEQHHQRQLARIAAERDAARQRQIAAEKAKQEADMLLAKVDSDASKEVPSAMEPLAQLMGEDEDR